MIGKIRKGSGFKGCVNYVLGKEQAALLHAEGILAESNRDIIRSFILQAGMNPDLKKPVGHIALSYSPVDAPKLTDGKMVQLAQEYMREMNHRYAVHHRAPPRPGTSARTYRVQPYRQQRQDHFGQERHVPQRAGMQEAESQTRALFR